VTRVEKAGLKRCCSKLRRACPFSDSRLKSYFPCSTSNDLPMPSLVPTLVKTHAFTLITTRP